MISRREKEETIVSLYNKIAGRNIKVLPREKRIEEALAVFEPEDFKNTFLWAKHNEWCKERNILRTRIGWLCSYNVVAEHSDYKEPKEETAWTIVRNSTKH